ncbi:hypothetical protein GQ457_12G009170 [Hibiscus cannabinus]
MESEEGLKTVECLRGRLLAERQASHNAKQDAELMGHKLMELEKELKEETKVRNKAEKRLKLLRKKLESLKLLPALEENASDTTTSIKSFEISFSKENSNSPETTKSDTKDASHEKSSVTTSSGHQVPEVDDTRVEIDNGRNENYEDGDDDDDYVDNSLALVPLFLPETKLAPEIKMVSKSIGEILETLRHARERIQSSMERRQMIRVGPS